MYIQVYCQVCGTTLSQKEVPAETIVATAGAEVCPVCAERIREASRRAGYEEGYNDGYDGGRTSYDAPLAATFDLGYDIGYYVGEASGLRAVGLPVWNPDLEDDG
jgi:hypothetical protein